MNARLQHRKLRRAFERKDAELLVQDSICRLKGKVEMLGNARSHQTTGQACYRLVQRLTRMLELPPVLLPMLSWPGVLPELVTFRFHPLSDDCDEIWPLLRFLQLHLPKVDGVPIKDLRRACIDFVT